eukprot:TRINITY_DN1303_c0_g2_i4.p1 TRINITY_DN1303_c0_g2~~TRINITY_DN1303_c0_g2_i4.p1  ORF type:complete len:453 (+),score=48.70 TRINITY_DN1303_c0_g2_i4:2466-3824(+)
MKDKNIQKNYDILRRKFSPVVYDQIRRILMEQDYTILEMRNTEDRTFILSLTDDSFVVMIPEKGQGICSLFPRCEDHHDQKNCWHICLVMVAQGYDISKTNVRYWTNLSGKSFLETSLPAGYKGSAESQRRNRIRKGEKNIRKNFSFVKKGKTFDDIFVNMVLNIYNEEQSGMMNNCIVVDKSLDTFTIFHNKRSYVFPASIDRNFLAISRLGLIFCGLILVKRNATLKTIYKKTVCPKCCSPISSDHYRTCQYLDTIYEAIPNLKESKLHKYFAWYLSWLAMNYELHGNTANDAWITSMYNKKVRSLDKDYQEEERCEDIQEMKRSLATYDIIRLNKSADWTIYTDGSSIESNDFTVFSIIFKNLKTDQTKAYSFRADGKMSVPDAEYIALQLAVQMANKLPGIKNIFSDCSSAILKAKEHGSYSDIRVMYLDMLVSSAMKLLIFWRKLEW